MNKLMATLVAGVFTMVPVTAVFAQDKAPAAAKAEAPDCKAAATKVAECKKDASMTAECKAAETTAGMAACKKADAAAAPKKAKKGGC